MESRKFLVSVDTSYTYTNFTLGGGISEIIDDVNEGDIVVLHNNLGSDLQVGMDISKLVAKGVGYIIYISTDGKPNDILISSIQSQGGYVIIEDSEEFVEEDSLEYIIEEVTKKPGGNQLVSVSNLQFLENFAEEYSSGIEVNKSKYYLNKVGTALSEMIQSNKEYCNRFNSIGNQVMNIFDEVSATSEETRKIRIAFEERVKELQEQINKDSRKSIGGAVFVYPTIVYNGTKRVLLLKEKVEGKYALSFILGYKEYLSRVKHQKVKLLVCCQNFKVTTERYLWTNKKGEYGCFLEVDSTTVNMRSIREADTLLVTEPSSKVINALLSTICDTFIIVDKLYGDDIVRGDKVKRKYLVNSLGSIDRLNLKPEACIVPEVNAKRVFASIPRIENYPVDIETRIDSYLDVCEGQYKKFDKLLGM